MKAGMRVAIVEDEAIVAQRLERMVAEVLDSHLERLDLLPSLEEARRHLETHPIDLLFLDLNLNGSDGFSLLHEAMAGAFATIVVSAHEEEAMQAFELGVTDFVPKPFSAARVAQAIRRVEERSSDRGRETRRLAIRKVGGITLVEVSRIRYIRGADDYSALHLEGDATELHEKSLSALELCLPQRFARCHRSHLVDLDRVREFRSLGAGRYQLVLDDGTELPVARRRVAELRRKLV